MNLKKRKIERDNEETKHAEIPILGSNDCNMPFIIIFIFFCFVHCNYSGIV